MTRRPLIKWKMIKEFPRYQVSNLGDVRNTLTGKPIKGFKAKIRGVYAYLCVSLYLDTKKKTKRVHALVAQAFVLNPGNLPCVNHKDGVKLHNWSTNLEWSTYGANNKHAYDTGLKKPIEGKRGADNATALFTQEQAEEIRREHADNNASFRSIAKLHGTCHHVISDLINRKSYV